MPENRMFSIIYGKEDIEKSCKYCEKLPSDYKKGISSRGRYDYECIIKKEKRKRKECNSCLFSHI